MASFYGKLREALAHYEDAGRCLEDAQALAAGDETKAERIARLARLQREAAERAWRSVAIQ